MGTLVTVPPQAASSILRVVSESLFRTNNLYSKWERITIPKRLLKVGNKGSCLVWKGKTCLTESFSCTLSNSRCLALVNHDIPGLTRQKSLPKSNVFPASGSVVGIVKAMGRDESPLSLKAMNSSASFNKGLWNYQRRMFANLPHASTVMRDDRFSKLNEEDVSHFRRILGDNGVVVDSAELKVANTDWMKKYIGHSQLLLRPRNTQQVAEILQYCNSRVLAVVPQGGNTGLAGGSVPVFDEIVLNLGAMNKIISFDEVSGILVCEAGCILQTADDFVGNLGFIVPLDLGAKGSCQIGGNVSTNAGGLRLLRYGSMHANVLGLEVVLADGTILDLLGTLRKDNTGYDLKHLFIGAEGTLGVVTKVSILTPPKLTSTNVAFLAVKDFLTCQRILREAKKQLGEILSAFEFIDRCAMDITLKHLQGCRDPLPDSKPSFYILLETTGSNESHDREKLDKFLEALLEKELITDGTVAQDSSQAASFWRVREGIGEALVKSGAMYKYDLSLPVKDLYDLVDDLRVRIGDGAVVVGFGHLGDGNLHLNICLPKYDDKILALVEPYVYEWTASVKGSVSAEHGLGFMKPNAIHYSKPPAAVQLMSGFKKYLDPVGILNPYKVLPAALDSESSSTTPKLKTF